MTNPRLSDVVSAQRLRARLREQGRTVVFTNGCFDLLHPGHVRLLESARAQGDFLIVGLNADQSVRGLKGAHRPVIPESERAANLAALEPVDHVVLYADPTPQALIEAIVPDVLVKGADWPIESIVGRDVVEAAGGRVVRIDLLSGRSTSAILGRLRTP